MELSKGIHVGYAACLPFCILFPPSYGTDCKEQSSDVGFGLILAMGKGGRYGTAHCRAGIEQPFPGRTISRVITSKNCSKASCGSSVRERMGRQVVTLAMKIWGLCPRKTQIRVHKLLEVNLSKGIPILPF